MNASNALGSQGRLAHLVHALLQARLISLVSCFGVVNVWVFVFVFLGGVYGGADDLHMCVCALHVDADA